METHTSKNTWAAQTCHDVCNKRTGKLLGRKGQVDIRKCGIGRVNIKT